MHLGCSVDLFTDYTLFAVMQLDLEANI